jgi:hypothetical protein
MSQDDNKTHEFTIYEPLDRPITVDDWNQGNVNIFSEVYYDFNKKLWFFYNSENGAITTLKTTIKNNALMSYLNIIYCSSPNKYKIIFHHDMFTNNSDGYTDFDYNLNEKSKIKKCINLIYQMPH